MRLKDPFKCSPLMVFERYALREVLRSHYSLPTNCDFSFILSPSSYAGHGGTLFIALRQDVILLACSQRLRLTAFYRLLIMLPFFKSFSSRTSVRNIFLSDQYFARHAQKRV
jgi:hypothetical protein